MAVTRADAAWAPWERLALLGGVAGAAVHLARFSHPDHAIDDAWISFRVARNLLEHGVPTYNVGQPPVEGMTNLLWTLLSTSWIAAFPQLDPLVPARVVAWVCQLGAVALAGAAARRLALGEGARGFQPAVAVLVTTGLCALSGSMAFHASTGLETGLWALLTMGAVERATAGRGFATGALLAAAFATRPEAALLGPTLLVALALGVGERDRRREALRGAVVLLVGVAAVEAFRWGTYGALLPNTFYAKPATTAGAGEYARRWLFLAGGGGLGILALVPSPGRGRLSLLVGVAAVSAAGALATGGDWMPGLRRLTEATLIVYVVAGAGVAVARGAVRAAAGVGAIALAASSVGGIVRADDGGLYPHEVLARVGALVAATPGVRSAGIADIGRFGWAFPGEIFDFAGLVDARIAHRAGEHGHKEWDEAYFRERAPDLVFVTTMRDLAPGRPPELRSLDLPVARSIVEHGGYTPWRGAPTLPGQWLVVFVRDGVTLPEEQWGPRDPSLAAAFGMAAPP